MWVDLSVPWQACLDEAWAACMAGSMPIGAVVVSSSGQILSRGRNRIRDTEEVPGEICGHHFAHAEMNCLFKVAKLDKAEAHQASLYTTLQPCPMCFGTFYAAGLRELHYASRDAYGGGDDALGKTPYLSRKPIKVFPPDDPELEQMVIALYTADALANPSPGFDAVLEEEKKILPLAFSFGEFLHKEKWITRMRETRSTPRAVYDNLVYLFMNVFPSSR